MADIALARDIAKAASDILTPEENAFNAAVIMSDNNCADLKRYLDRIKPLQELTPVSPKLSNINHKGIKGTKSKKN